MSGQIEKDPRAKESWRSKAQAVFVFAHQALEYYFILQVMEIDGLRVDKM